MPLTCRPVCSQRRLCLPPSRVFIRQTDKIFGSVWSAYLRSGGLSVCLRNGNDLSVCLHHLPRHLSFLARTISTVVRTRECAHMVQYQSVYLLQIMSSSYQLRRSCCASASLYRVRGLSFPTEFPAMEKVRSFADALAGIAKSSKARCRKSGNLV